MMCKFISLALTCLNFLAQVCAQHATDSRPNIIFILSDDHAYQAVSAYGHGLNHTPNIDLLAKQGMLFNRAFVNNSLCAPSRAAFLTGKYSHLNGIRGNGNEVFNGSQPTFPALLKKGGYQTALFGKWHLGSDPVGFDEWNILPGQGDYYNPDFINANGKSRQQGYVTDLTTDFALAWLDHRDTASPFCLLVWNKAPHRNWMPALKYLHLFDSTGIPVPPNLFDDYATRTKAAHKQEMEISKWLTPNYDLKESFEPGSLTHRYDDLWKNVLDRLDAGQKKTMEAAYTTGNEALLKAGLSGRELTLWKYQRYVKDYLRCVQSVDDNVGRLMSYLRDKGLENNTIVIYASDQGFYLGEHGWFDKRFMYEESFRTPLLIRWPKLIKPGTSSNELVMNIDLAQTLLEVAGLPIPGEMQGQTMLPVLRGEQPAFPRKYVYYHYYESEGEHAVAKHVGIRSDTYKLIHFYENHEWELFDLKKDPSEMNNVYGDPHYKGVVEEMKKELENQMKRYQDNYEN